LKLTAAAYPARTAELLLSETDPFRNPVGGALRRGLPVLLEAALGDDGFKAAAPVIDELLRIRSLQFNSAEDAVSFVPLLKTVIRRHADLDRHVEDRIDRLTQMAYDAWGRCRSALGSLQENERRRRNYLPGRMHRS
jgi:hypothetical protein